MTQRLPFTRLIVLFAILLAIIVAVCGGAIYTAGQRAIRAQQIADLERLTPLLRRWLSDSATPPPEIDEATRRRLVDASHVLETRISIINGDGSLVIDTNGDVPRMTNHNNRPEVIAAREQGMGSAVRFSSTLEEDAVYFATLLDPQRPQGVVLRLSFPRHLWSDRSMPGWVVVGGGVVAALLTVVILWFILQRLWIGPTYTLVKAAEKMAAGDFGTRVEPRGAGELRFFSTRLNMVAAYVQAQLTALDNQRADLQSLVDTLPDPIFVTEEQGHVSLLNLPAARLLSVDRGAAVGEQFVTLLNEHALLELVDRVADPAGRRRSPAATSSIIDSDEITTQPSDGQNGYATLTRAIRLNRDSQRHIYQAVAKRTAARGVLLVLRDVTALASAVQMKTDFVANASHELRTPIAAIKIAFETLRDIYGEDPVQAERCMQIIDEHLQRLQEMLRDLLDLSRVENANLKPQTRQLKLADVMAQMRSGLGSMARQKGVELRLGVSESLSPPTVVSDERLLNLISKNLMENSIKFTPPGGTVTVDFRRADEKDQRKFGDKAMPADSFVMSVADTGVGISPEHLDRVFERFYQVDPARSGTAGRGTGLGLAIVKHAVAALGGAVRIESQLGKGTTIECLLPQIERRPEEEAAGIS